MSFEDVLLICFEGCDDEARAFCDNVLSHCPADQRPEVHVTLAGQLMQGVHTEPHGIAWVYAGALRDEVLLYETLEQLSNAHLPTLITRHDEQLLAGTIFQGGAVIMPPDTDPEQICLVIQSLASQAETIQHLCHELSITRRHHGGLRGQMDKLDEELRLAARVQQEFLPANSPAAPNAQVEVLFRPASYVSGDIYDTVRLDENHIGLWIADVVGHGVPAALLTMFVKHALPTKEIAGSSYRIVPPNEAIARLNLEMVHRPGGGNRFATAVYAVLNTQTLQLQVARAGHPLPLLLRKDDEIVQLDPDGALLGVFAEENYELMTLQLEEGDRLMLFSDGFECCFGYDHDGKLNTTRYQSEFAKFNDCTPSQAIARLDQLIDAQPGSLHQVDDLTVIMLAIGKFEDAKTEQERMEHTIRCRTVPTA